MGSYPLSPQQPLPDQAEGSTHATQDRRTAKFWDRIAERYSNKPVADEAAYQKKLQFTREYLRPDMELALSVLHLLENKEEAIAKVFSLLKPGGLFVTSTACLGDSMKIFKVIAPVGRVLGLLPIVKVFTAQELEQSLRDAGFAIDYQWQPGKNKGVFIVARKPL